MAPKIPKYNNWWEELFPSPEMSRDPKVRSGQRKKMVGPVHVNRWGPNKEAWGKIGRFALGLPSQQEIDRAAKLRNNRIKNEDIAKLAELTGDTSNSDNDNKTALLEKTKPKNNSLNTNFAGGPLPNTEETPNSKDPIKLPEVEKGGSRWVGANSTWVGRDNKVIAPNIKDIPKNQVPSVLLEDGSGLKTVKSVQKEIAKSPSIIQSLKIQGTNVLNKGKDMLNNAIASLPKSKEIAKVGMFDGTKAGTAKGLNTVSAGIDLLAKLTQRKKKQSTAGMEGGGGNIDQVAVVPNTNFDEFGTLVG